MQKILVVDDEQDVLLMLNSLLQRNGYEVATTISCEEASAILDIFHPDFILMDVNVGTQDGRNLCKKIKSEARHEHISVVLISGNEELLRSYKECGATTFLRKPFPSAILIDMLKKHVG
jgi:CheY-like chemotaxis protein